MIQWSVELREFDIEYVPRTAIKAQVLAEFVVEYTCPEEQNLEDLDIPAWILRVDGSKAKKESGAGVVIQTPAGDLFKYALEFKFQATNNQAEYEALVTGLKLARAMGAKYVEAYSDSQLVVGKSREIMKQKRKQ